MDASTEYVWGETLPTLVGRSTMLRMPTSGDGHALVQVMNSEETLAYWAGRLITDEDDARASLEKSNRAFGAREFFHWAIALPNENKLIGLCKLYQVNDKHQSASVGFVLGRDHWGRGLMTDALHTLLEFAFDKLGLRRLEAFTHPQNERAHRVLQRQGFVVEGCLRERYIGRAGPQDAALLGLLRRQWVGAGVYRNSQT